MVRSLDEEVITLIDLIRDMSEALLWCLGSEDFGTGGQARKGWIKLCDPVLKRARAILSTDNNGEN